MTDVLDDLRADGDPIKPGTKFDPTEPHKADRIEPDRAMQKLLRDEMVKIAGFAWCEFRWSPERGCICTFERDKRGFVSIRTEIRDEDGKPRQVDHRDVSNVVDWAYGRREIIDKFIPRFLAKQAAMREKAKEERAERIHETVKEMVRVARYGTRPYVEVTRSVGDGESEETYKVIDRREVK